MEYSYLKIDAPDLDKIHFDVENSTMNNKSIDFCLWNEKEKVLKIFWLNELSYEDKTMLDLIIKEE